MAVSHRPPRSCFELKAENRKIKPPGVRAGPRKSRAILGRPFLGRPFLGGLFWEAPEQILGTNWGDPGGMLEWGTTQSSTTPFGGAQCTFSAERFLARPIITTKKTSWGLINILFGPQISPCRTYHLFGGFPTSGRPMLYGPFDHPPFADLLSFISCATLLSDLLQKTIPSSVAFLLPLPAGWAPRRRW